MLLEKGRAFAFGFLSVVWQSAILDQKIVVGSPQEIHGEKIGASGAPGATIIVHRVNLTPHAAQWCSREFGLHAARLWNDTGLQAGVRPARAALIDVLRITPCGLEIDAIEWRLVPVCVAKHVLDTVA